MIVTWTSQNWNEKKKKNTSSKGDYLSTILLFVHNKVNKGGQSSMVDYYLLTKIVSICDYFKCPFGHIWLDWFSIKF